MGCLQEPFWVRAQPMRDDVTLLRRLSLAKPILRIIGGLFRIQTEADAVLCRCGNAKQ